MSPQSPAPETSSSPSSAGALVRLTLAIAAIVTVALVLGAGDLLIVIIAILAMVMLHELGHLLAAKWARMKVTEYFIGFGPRLWSIRRGETTYGVKAIPAGGYVKIPGMTNLEEVDPADEPRTYRQQPFRKRLVVACAGSFMHYLMAFVLAWGALVFIGAPSASVVQIQGFTRFQGMTENPAQRAGLRIGDRVIAVDGHALRSLDSLSNVISHDAGKVVHLLVERDGHERTITVIPVNGVSTHNGQTVRPVAGTQHGYIGVELTAAAVPENPVGALGGAASVVGHTTVNAVTGLAHLFSPHGISTYIAEVTNPSVAAQDQRSGVARPVSIVGAVREATQGARAGAGPLIEVLIAINIFVGLLNMLPMLPLDGGHVAIALYERVRTRRGRPYYQADAAKLLPVAYAFMLVLALLVSSSLYLDITHPVPNPFG